MASPTLSAQPNPLAQMAARIAQSQSPTAHAEPSSTKKALFEVDAVLATSVASWLRKRGKVLRPKLSDEQRKQLAECFELMDADGSGAIDADELGNAFKLLGLHVKKHEIVAMLDEVDRDGSGEVEYLEFIEIMTTTLHKLAEEKEQESGASTSSQVPFALMATAYRRKRIMESLISGDKEMTAQIAQMGESKRWEEEEEKQAAKAHALEQAQAKASQAASMDSMDSLISPGIAHALSRMKSGGLTHKNMSGLLDVVDDGEEQELTMLLRQRTKEHLEARAASEQAMKQVPGYNSFRESPSHKMLMQQLNVPKMRLHVDGSCRSPSQAGTIRSPSRHSPSPCAQSLSRAHTSDLGCTSPTPGAPESHTDRRSCTSIGAPSPRLPSDAPSNRSRSACGIALARARDTSGCLDTAFGDLDCGEDYAALTAALTGAGTSTSTSSNSCGMHTGCGDARVYEFQLQPPAGVAQHRLPRRATTSCALGGGAAGRGSTGGGNASCGWGATLAASSRQGTGACGRSCAGSPLPGAAGGGAQLELMGHATGLVCNGGVLRNQGGVLSCSMPRS